MQHTPGPWQVTQDDEWPFSIRVHAADGGIIALYQLSHSTAQDTAAECMAGFGMSRPEEASAHNHQQLANATIHAAAPQMLAALRHAVAVLAWLCENPHNTINAEESYGIVSAAIAKATGLTEG